MHPTHRNHPPHAQTTGRWALLAALSAGVLLVSACAPWRMWTAVELARDAQPFTAHPAEPVQRLLVVGDSTAVGTGATSPEQSLPGLIGRAHPQWRIDNLAANGARFADVAQQLEGAASGYDMVLVLAGGNDVIRLTRGSTLRTQVHRTVELATQKGKRVVLMPCGDVGHAPFFAPPLSWLMSSRSKHLHAMAQEAAAAAANVQYVSLLKPRDQDPFVLRRQMLNAADGLHPSSAGYQEWYRELVAQGAMPPTSP
jgi:lysophospholipase L1-like esterase